MNFIHIFLGFFGVFAAIGVCFFWDAMKNMKEDIDIIDIIEHYHYGLVIIALSKFAGVFNSFFLGFGLMLIVDEFRHTHPFAYKSKHFTGSSIIGIILMLIMLYYIYIYGEYTTFTMFWEGKTPI